MARELNFPLGWLQGYRILQLLEEDGRISTTMYVDFVVNGEKCFIATYSGMLYGVAYVAQTSAESDTIKFI